jgi:hypothetical protein
MDLSLVHHLPPVTLTLASLVAKVVRVRSPTFYVRRDRATRYLWSISFLNPSRKPSFHSDDFLLSILPG